MVEVLVAAATGLLTLITGVVVELIRRMGNQGKVLGEVATQVKNQHDTNLRDDITSISKKVDQIHVDLSVEREDRRDLARAHYALAEVVNRLSRECPLVSRPPAPPPPQPAPSEFPGPNPNPPSAIGSPRPQQESST